MITINYHTDSEIGKDQTKLLKKWIGSSIFRENRIVGEVNYIICNDERLLEINQQFLNHDTYTDIITFPTSQITQIISGEIYVSISRIIENATLNNVSVFDEFCRVFIHGVLHLIGYNDHTPAEKKEMRAKEDYYLTLRP